MDLREKLMIARPGAEWNLSGDTYEGIVWLDQVQTKPTEAELDAIN